MAKTLPGTTIAGMEQTEETSADVPRPAYLHIFF